MKLSVITINYNNRDGLRKTVESVVNQTCRDFEYIVIDGGSTDGSVDVIKQYADNIDYWVSEPDKGIYNAMNKGIAVAHGEYLNFMNSGDCFYNCNSIAEFVNLQANEDIVFGNMVDSNTGKRMGCISSDNITAADFLNASLPHQASFIHKDAFEKYGLYDEKYKIASDWKFFFCAIVFMSAPIKYVNITFAKYDNEGISTSIYGTESELILKEICPNRLIPDCLNSVSLKEVQKSNVCKILYSALYRLSVVLRHIRKL